MTRDKIVVEREYDGQFCGHKCALLETGEDSCSRTYAWCNGFGVQKLVVGNDDRPIRCNQCVLTDPVSN